MDVAHHLCRVARELRRGVLVGRIGDVYQVMRDAAAIGRRNLVGTDVESAIHGGRITVDDLAAVAVGNGEGERALPGRGRTENRHERLVNGHAPGRK